MPCNVKGVFFEPIIINVVAVKSNIIPKIRKVSTNEVTKCFLCSEIIPIVYENNAKLTIIVPVNKIGFIRPFNNKKV